MCVCTVCAATTIHDGDTTTSIHYRVSNTTEQYANKFTDLIGGQTGNDNYQFSQMHRTHTSTATHGHTNTSTNSCAKEFVSMFGSRIVVGWLMACGVKITLGRKFRAIVRFHLSVSHWACAFRIPHPAQPIKNDFKNKTIKISVPCWRFATSDRMVLSRQPTKLNIR